MSDDSVDLAELMAEQLQGYRDLDVKAVELLASDDSCCTNEICRCDYAPAFP